MQADYRIPILRWSPWVAVTAGVVFLSVPSMTWSQPKADADKPRENTPSSYDQIAPVLLGKESFQEVLTRDKADKESVMARQKKLLDERYDLTPRPDPKLTMSRGKPIQVGPTARLPEGMTWEKLAAMSSDQIRDNGLFPKGFLPLPHPKHEVGGMVFPQMEIKLLPRLQRFDVDFDLPEQFLPEFPPAVATAQGPIKTFTLRGIKESPPYFHDGRLLTLEDTVEFFNLILELKLDASEKKALVAFMLQL